MRVQVRNMVISALCAALLCLCGWIAIPIGGTVLTLQTFGVFLCLMLLGGKWGSISVLIYILLGAVGLPVFSAGQGGLSVLLGPTGGFLIGFLLACPVYRMVFHFSKKSLAACFCGLPVCYLTGALWYGALCKVDFLGAVAVTVAPFLAPDICKILLAYMLAKRLRPVLSSPNNA